MHDASVSAALLSQDALPLSAVGSTFSVGAEALRFDMGHHHTVNVASYRALLNGLVHTMCFELPQLEQFSIMNFAKSRWHSNLAGTPYILQELTMRPVPQALTTLDLQLDMSTHNTGLHLAQVSELIGRNPNLKVFKLCAGPDMEFYHRLYNKNWAHLLEALGSDPPFRLHTLEIDGLIASTTAPTLDRIIDVHSSNLRRLVLKNTNFCPPNSLGAFFNALANSEVRYYAWKQFMVPQAICLMSSRLLCSIVPDEALTPTYYNGLAPESDKDWVHITRDFVDNDGLFVWDDYDESMEKGGIKSAFRGVGIAIKCGAIECI
ncbi:hypothetical protein PtrSN002B_008281 [Pyrenophora tritici-repentis]|nr:hypothetical protein PtrV1_06250 [Pyrenophora tritici-repentis]KAG9380814.1 hypothetical protein A1F94_008134 [Pyrenophora tritici-repentis]KAI0573266.1 hypothetical protein Alg215_09290 [Pyrenophora tritici-repentis]KAI0577083.1 hypothetical protein Alg130_08533 [Pyrenophora tritici-repentis]KAI0607135.1 hypothetical protein TUN205_08617 [Pyrenophora tritici-repentis]